mgnify:CR=1 FL=1
MKESILILAERVSEMQIKAIVQQTVTVWLTKELNNPYK